MMRTQARWCVVVLVCTALLLVVGSAAAHYDLGGRTIRINNREMAQTPFVSPGEANWAEPDSRLQAHIDWVEEFFNVTIEFVTIAGNRQQAIIEGILTGQPEADVFLGLPQDQVAITAIALEGLVHPVDEYIDQEWIQGMPEMYRAQALALPVHGRSYAFTGQYLAVSEQMVVAFNKELFENENLPNPYELYVNGEWTWDAFRDIAYQAARDTTGDGEIDQFGASSWQIMDTGWGTGIGIVDWAMSNGGQLGRIEDGRMTFTFHEPVVVEAFDFWKQLYADGVARRGDLGVDGQVALVVTAVHTLGYEAVRNVPFDWGIVPLPKGPNMTEHVAPRGIGNGAGTAIPITEDDPQGVIEVINALMQLTDKYADVAWQEERFYDDMELLVYDRESLDVLKWVVLNGDPWNYDYQFIYTMDQYRQAVNAAWEPDANAAVALAEAAPAIQSYIDEMFGQ